MQSEVLIGSDTAGDGGAINIVRTGGEYAGLDAVHLLDFFWEPSQTINCGPLLTIPRSQALPGTGEAEALPSS